MKLEKWALIAEVVGGVAIVASLVVLIFEVRANTAAIQASSRESIAGRIEERAMDAAANSELLEALVVARSGGQIDLDSVEGARLRFFYSSLVTSVEEAFLQYREGRLDEEFFEARAARAIRANFLNPTGREYLANQRRSESLVEEFLDWIDETYPVGDDVSRGN